MFDQVLDNFRKATESTMQFQQEMFKNWSQQWTKAADAPSGAPVPNGEFVAQWSEAAQAFQKQWAESVTSLLKKHRETLDAQYSAGVTMIEDAFRLGEAKDAAQLRRLTEDLWRHSFDCLKTVAEEQMREFQAAGEAFRDAANKASATAKAK